MAKSSKNVLNTYKKQYQKSQKQWRKKTGLPVNKKKNFYDKYTVTSKPYKPKKTKPIKTNAFIKSQQSASTNDTNNNGCYIATCIYGSYDCPQVWTLRRFRDYTLDDTWYGRVFIKCYYVISPTLVKWFGNQRWFRIFWKNILDIIVSNLKQKGIEDTQYLDKY